MTQRTLTLLSETFVICRLAPDASLPEWAMRRDASFFSVTQTFEELSVICNQAYLPVSDAEIVADRDWRCLKLEGPFEMDEPGVLAGLVGPLAAQGISVFAEATYDTDYLLINDCELAIKTLEDLGHIIKRS